MNSCRDEVLVAAASLAARSADGTFTPDDVVRALASQGSQYQESTIRTYVTSVMCADAPVHHMNHTNDLRRVDHGRYALIAAAAPGFDRTTPDLPSVRAEETLPTPATAAGDSTEQRDAEVQAIQLLASRLGVALLPERLELTDGSVVHVDGVSHDPAILVEAWAHQGPPKAAQKHKVLSDALKLSFVAAALGAQHRRAYRRILLFSDEQAAAPFRRSSWQAGALSHHGIEIEVVELSDATHQRIKRAQERQFR